MIVMPHRLLYTLFNRIALSKIIVKTAYNYITKNYLFYILHVRYT